MRPAVTLESQLEPQGNSGLTAQVFVYKLATDVAGTKDEYDAWQPAWFLVS
jgi:hypothetical protein